jgi:hypothetical protein
MEKRAEDVNRGRPCRNPKLFYGHTDHPGMTEIMQGEQELITAGSGNALLIECALAPTRPLGAPL